jgi:AcrR family transcriptional regulator
MSTAALDLTAPETRDSERPQSEFPRSVNWNNPRVAAILETAARCFSKGGFTTTTLADIGKELGLRKSIVHYYFTSKATLVREVQSFAYGQYLEVIRRTLLGSSEGPQSGTAPSGQSSPASGVSPTAGLGQLWAAISKEGSLRGLNLELWSEGRRNEELATRAEILEAEAQKLLASYFEGAAVRPDLDSDDLAALTLSLLDGLTVRQEREGDNARTSRAFATFLKLLQK